MVHCCSSCQFDLWPVPYNIVVVPDFMPTVLKDEVSEKWAVVNRGRQKHLCSSTRHYHIELYIRYWLCCTVICKCGLLTKKI